MKTRRSEFAGGDRPEKGSAHSGGDICGDFIELVTEVSDTLKRNAGDLSPGNTEVTRCLTHFVGAVLDVKNAGDPHLESLIMENEKIRRLRSGMLAHLREAEYRMEHYFAEIFAQYPALSSSDLDLFWYRNNYRRIAEDEIAAIRGAGLDLSGQRIVFAGSGPLPLTAIEMCYALPDEDIQITCLDKVRPDNRAATATREEFGVN